MLTAPELRALLRRHGLRLTKRLGQHDLIDPQLVKRLIDACRLSREDTVVEIGAGLGALTIPLAERAGRVIAVEVDKRIAELLAQHVAHLKNVRVAHEDILRFAWRDVPGAVVIGAIPYHITSQIFVSLCEARRTIQRVWLIVQQEYAERLLAQPGTKAYGRLSILGQFCWEMTRVMAVPRSAFFPQPVVDSSGIRLSPRFDPPLPAEEEAAFFEFVKAVFAHRRKTLANCLADEGWDMSRAGIQQRLREMDVSASVRGEALSLDQLVHLYHALHYRFE